MKNKFQFIDLISQEDVIFLLMREGQFDLTSAEHMVWTFPNFSREFLKKILLERTKKVVKKNKK